MASENDEGDGGGGFGWGFILGGLIGAVAGAYLASGPGREQVEGLRTRTIELTGRTDELRARARSAMAEGVSAARKRRAELDIEAASAARQPEEAPGT